MAVFNFVVSSDRSPDAADETSRNQSEENKGDVSRYMGLLC
jgi:hypothetical protein